jgi:hypothetical protein
MFVGMCLVVCCAMEMLPNFVVEFARLNTMLSGRYRPAITGGLELAKYAGIEVCTDESVCRLQGGRVVSWDWDCIDRS